MIGKTTVERVGCTEGWRRTVQCLDLGHPVTLFIGRIGWLWKCGGKIHTQHDEPYMTAKWDSFRFGLPNAKL